MIRQATPLVRRAVQKRWLLHGTRGVAASLQAESRPIEGRQSGTFLAAAAVAVCSLTAASSETTSCQQQDENPLWPSGVSEKDVDDFVDAVLADPSINMSAIPDSVEREIYKAAVSMTCNVIYETLSTIQGTEFFAHELKLRRRHSKRASYDEDHTGIDDAVLEKICDRLLANSSINQTMVPDSVERQLYINCLKIIFHLLDTMATTFCLTMCGHDLKLHFEPSKRKDLSMVVSSETMVDVAELQALAREEIGSTGLYAEFQAQLLASLYGLVVGVVDDLLANTEIKVLSDRVGIDIAPMKKRRKMQLRKKIEDIKAATTSASPGQILPFGVGVGVGAILMALVSGRDN